MTRSFFHSRFRVLFAGAALAMASATSPLAAQSVTYAQGTFNPSDWQQISIEQSGGWAGTSTLLGAGGNPGSYWQVTSGRPVVGGGGSVRLANINTLFTYDPGTRGALTALDFSFDGIGLSSSGYSAQFFGFFRPIIRQNGSLYSVAGSDAQPTTSWATYNFSYTPASSWISVIAGNTSLPDFTGAGGIIEFGYRFTGGGTCNSNNCTITSTASGLDNYAVTATSVTPTATVPEPSTYALMAAGLAGLLIVQRRRRA